MSRKGTGIRENVEQRIISGCRVAFDPRSTDPMSALEIAMIVRGLSDISKAAELIESFARCRESGARVEAIAAAYDHVLGRISRETADAQG